MGETNFFLHPSRPPEVAIWTQAPLNAVLIPPINDLHIFLYFFQIWQYIRIWMCLLKFPDQATMEMLTFDIWLQCIDLALVYSYVTDIDWNGCKWPFSQFPFSSVNCITVPCISANCKTFVTEARKSVTSSKEQVSSIWRSEQWFTTAHSLFFLCHKFC